MKTIALLRLLIASGLRQGIRNTKFLRQLAECKVFLMEVITMKKLEEGQVALIIGTFVGLIHVVWSLMVALGLAQLYLDWILGLHFLNNPFIIGPFEPTNALILIIVTFVAGYLVGWVFTWIWNRILKK